MSQPNGRQHRWFPAAAGVIALAVGLGVAELAAGALGRTATPVVAVGEAFIDVVPAWLKDVAVAWFGTADKAVLLGGMVAVLVALGAVVGVIGARDRRAGLLAAGALLGVAALAVWSRPDTTATDLVPTLLGGAVALAALSVLQRRAAGVAATPSGEDVAGRWPDSDPGRRSFLTAAAAGGLLAVGAGGVGRWLGARRIGVEASRQDLAAEVDLPAADPPPGTDLGIRGAEPWRTPNDVFYRIDTALSVPLIQAADWRLRVHGLVERPVEITYGDLVDMGLVDRWLTLMCVSNEVGGGLTGNALWTGVPVADVLALAGPRPEADAVLSTSDDGWTAGTPLEALTDGRDSLLAVGMNGEPLPVDHGFPVRMVVPGLYGYVSATKWVVDLEVSRFDEFDAYWTTRGWSELGPVKVSSRIDVPRARSEVAAGTVAVAGVAWAQHRGIAAVEVRVDDGEWAAARLGDVPSADTWRQWVWEWDARPGRHTLAVRATTADGEQQTWHESRPAPDGASGWHRIEVDVGTG